MKKVINGGKRSKTLSELKTVKNISKNLHSFQETCPEQKKVLSQHKLQDHAYVVESFRLKEVTPQRNCQNQLSHQGLPHIEQECQDSLIQGKIQNQQSSNEVFEYL